MSSRALSFSSSRVPPGRRALRVAAVLLGVAATLVLVWAAVLALLWGYAWWRLGPDELPVLEEPTVLGSGDAGAPQDATTVLVTMTGPVDPTEPRPPELLGPVALVQFGADRVSPAVLTLPDELTVTVEGEGDLSLADVQDEGGTELLVRAVGAYSEVRIDHAVSLSVDALPELVDAVGPVEVCDPAGCSPTTGEQLRNAIASAGDRELPGVVAGAARGLGRRVDGRFVVSSPLAMRRVVDIVDAEVSTDVPLRGLELLDVAGALAATGELDADIIPLIVNPESGEILPLPEPAMVRFQHLRDGTSLGGTAESAGTDDLRAGIVGDARVAVLNGAGIDGLASRVRAELETAGFQVVGTGNAASFDRSETVVNYVVDEPTTEFAAAELAETLDGAELEPLGQRPEFEGEDVDLLVTVGEDLGG